MSNQWTPRKLPEDYGKGQREFDLAFAARNAATHYVGLFAGVAGMVFGQMLGSWLWGLLIAPPLYWILMRPLNKALERGRAEWRKDMEAWRSYLDDPR